jgi:hypothetical protein
VLNPRKDGYALLALEEGQFVRVCVETHEEIAHWKELTEDKIVVAVHNTGNIPSFQRRWLRDQIISKLEVEISSIAVYEEPIGKELPCTNPEKFPSEVDLVKLATNN